MASLVLRCLGTPQCVTDSGEPVRFRTRKHLALLIRLAVEPGRPLSRHYLTDLLWPAAAPTRAAHSLAQAVSVVRAQVGREHILVQRAGVTLANGAVAVDVLRLESEDVEIAGGFLDGFEVPRTRPFEDWTDEWRAKLLPRLRDCLVRQMDAGRRRGDFATVERHAAVLSELDPLSEDAVRGTIEARAWVGDRTSALRAYAAYGTRLAEALGAKPSVDLARMADLLREGRHPPTPRSVGEPSVRAEKRFEPEPLIGREREFSALSDAWVATRGRTPHVVVLLGDPGLGKTTLANAFVSTCQLEGAVVARAQAYEAERELPFAVLAELVRQLALQRAIGCAEPEALSELSRLTPEIAITFPGVPKPVQWTPDVMPLRLADAFLRTITAAADEGPVVIVVDDIHAADNASVAILHAVARKLPPGRLLMILAGRPSELGVSGTAAALTTDAQVEGLRTLELEPLSTEASDALVERAARAAGAPDGDVPRRRILDAGRGNPLALSLLAREWAAHGPESLLRDLEAVNTQPVAVPGIPRAIKAVFERQVARLQPHTRAVLDLAAVLGRRLADLALYQAVDCTPAEAAEGLGRLRDEGLIREIHGGLEFRNELIRAQAYYAVPGPVRQHLHRRVGELLDSTTLDDGRALEGAWHFLRGADVSRALSTGLRGVQEALAAGAPLEAEDLSSALLSATSGSAENRTELLYVYAKALLVQSKAHMAIPILEELETRQTPDARLATEVACMRAAAEYLVNQEAGARYGTHAALALRRARCLGDASLIVRALLETARAAQEAGDEAPVLAASAELERLVAHPQFESLPQTHYALGFCSGILDDIRAKLEHYERYIELLRECDDRSDLPLAYNGRGVSRYSLCDLEGATQDLAVALDLAQRCGDDSRISLIAGNACSVDTARGRYEAAEVHGRLSIRAGTKSLSQPFLVGAYTNLIDVLMLTDRHREAEPLLESAREWTSRDRRWAARVFFLCERASLALMARDTSLALHLARRVEEMSRGRRAAVLQPGLLIKLRVFLSAYEEGPEKAFHILRDATARFQTHHPLLYLDVLAARVWLERRTNGHADQHAVGRIESYANAGLHGKIKLLQMQGFLEQPS